SFDGSVKDGSGWGRHLDARDIEFDQDRFGSRGAVRLNGITSSLLMVNPILDLAKDFTISMWASFDDVHLQYQGLFNSIVHNGVYIVFNHPPANGKLRFQLGYGGWIIE